MKRATKRIRDRQRERNRRAIEERDERVSEMERRAEMTPAERRAEDNRRRAERREARKIERDGRHRVKAEKEDYSNKMEAHPSVKKQGLDSLAWGSEKGKKLAEKEGLTVADFASSGVTASGENGYLIGDVRKILEQRDEG